MGAFGTQTGRNGTGQNGKGRDGTKCVLHTWNKPVPGEVGRKNTQNLSRGTAVPLIFGVPNAGRNASSRSVPSRPTYQTHPILSHTRRHPHLHNSGEVLFFSGHWIFPPGDYF
ncbi:hypothetical protein DVH24_000652 [Malus domestica]|uniref:Uncharacterized protein n=1 Tax=Malus domestica TaxID=3750 RepID=A0A498J5I6_MALDO|nr:hypothetical protein DVH24_000652 [Malus domestica]